MCGKFTQMISWADLVELADLQASLRDGQEGTVTPMRVASVVIRDEAGGRRCVRMRWGMVPPGAADPIAVKPHVHARAETIDSKPTFRDAFRHRRGIVAVTTFNEGRDITPSKIEQHVLTPTDGLPLAIAVVWNRWTGRGEGALLSFAMVTVPANALIGTITDRMPALLDAWDWARWLGEEPATSEELKALLRPSTRGLEMQKAAQTRRAGDQPSFL